MPINKEKILTPFDTEVIALKYSPQEQEFLKFLVSIVTMNTNHYKISTQNASYSSIKTLCSDLAKKNISVDIGEQNILIVHLFNSITYYNSLKKIEFELSNTIKTALINIKLSYSPKELENLLLLKHKRSKYLYIKILNSIRSNIKEELLDLHDLFDALHITPNSQLYYGDLNKYLPIATSELLQLNINISVEPVKYKITGNKKGQSPINMVKLNILI